MKGKQRAIVLGDPPSEKMEEHWADKTAHMLGFRVLRFSQPRKTMQTRGIPDRLYVHPVYRVAVWAELKAERGKLSAHQQDMLALLGGIETTATVHGTANVVGAALVQAIKNTQKHASATP